MQGREGDVLHVAGLGAAAQADELEIQGFVVGRHLGGRVRTIAGVAVLG